jgi:hypothetical protein
MHLSKLRALAIGKSVIVALIVVGAVGCGGGPERLSVAGHVTLDGQPLPDGDIIFRPTAATEGPTVAGSIENGAYDIPEGGGPVPGSYAVTINAERKTGRKIKADILGNATTDQYEQYLPARYNDKTELSAEIAESRDDLDFELTSKK